ncbi:MAG: protease modulator HflC, partial [Oscillospiraceae bacterium]|nr:protease modulator HflC [Oscillospiraceae bacterium]
KTKVFYGVIIVLAVIVLSILMSAFYTVQENEYALVVRFSRVISQTDSPGLHFKVPVLDDVRYYPKTKLFYDINQSDVLTADAKAMTVDSFIVWRISDPFVFYQRLGTIISAQTRLDAITYNALKNLIGTFEQDDIVGSADEQAEQDEIVGFANEQGDIIISADEKSRDYLNIEVTERAKINAAEFGIEVLDVKIKSFELPHDNEQSVFRRMISERERFAARERAEGEKEANLIKNDVDKRVNITVSDAKADAEKIIAEGEAEYMRRLAEAYNTPEKEEFYKFMRGLDALRTSLAGNEKTVILDKDSLLAQILIAP